MTSPHLWWGLLTKFWLAFYHLHDCPNPNIYVQNLTTIGPVVSEIMCLRLKIDTDRQADRQIDEQTDGNGRPVFS